MELPRIPNNQSNLEKEESWRHHTSYFQNLLQSYNNQTVWHWNKSKHAD
jgi:hypothetical protein